MSGDMIATIGAAVALGIGMFVSTRGIHKDLVKLRTEMSKLGRPREGDGQIKDEMKAGFAVIADRLTNVGDRLSKVEGVIEGMFWNARNLPLPPDTTREGAA